MSRLLFIIAVAVVVYLLLKSFRNRMSGKNTSIENPPLQAEDMVRCVHCGVHLPKHESIMVDSKFYCSKAHHRIHTEKSE